MVPNSPVGLSALTGGEIKLEERLLAAWSNAMHVVFDDGDTALVARLAHALEDLLRAVGVSIEPAHDLALVGIEFANARHTGALVELLNLGPLGHRARIHPQRTRGLRHGELLAPQVVTDLAEGLIVNHGGAPAALTVEPESPDRRCSRARTLVPEACPPLAGQLSSQEAPALGTAVPDRR